MDLILKFDPKPSTSEGHCRPTSAQSLYFASLTQVSRLVRQEFRPFFLAHSTFRLSWIDLNRFLRTFYPLQSPEPDPLGDIVVHVTDMCGCPDEQMDESFVKCEWDTYLNIFPLLKLA